MHGHMNVKFTAACFATKPKHVAVNKFIKITVVCGRFNMHICNFGSCDCLSVCLSAWNNSKNKQRDFRRI
jgi:hypothetical protein